MFRLTLCTPFVSRTVGCVTSVIEVLCCGMSVFA